MAKAEIDGEEKRNFPYVVAWILFLGSLFVAGGFILNPDPQKQLWGYVILCAPLLFFAGLMAIYYLKSRREAT
jgi:hypothetical protein